MVILEAMADGIPKTGAFTALIRFMRPIFADSPVPDSPTILETIHLARLSL